MKVLDFGLAKLRNPDPPSESSTMAAETATAEKMLVGSFPSAEKLRFAIEGVGVVSVWPSVRSSNGRTARHGLASAGMAPDGTRIAGFSQSAVRILIVDTQKPWPRKAAEELPRLDGDRLCGTPVWSPDGGRIACQTDREPPTIGIYRFDTRSYTELPGGEAAVWLNDGQRLLFMAEDGRLMLTDLRTKQARPLLSLLPDAIVMPRVTRDNRRVVFARARREGDVYMLTFK